MMKDAVFGSTKADGFQVSVSSLTLGTLYEAILAFSSQDRFESFWPSVCQNSRWLMPSRRQCILLRSGENTFEIAGRFEQGKFQQPADAPYAGPGDKLRRALAKKNPQWFSRPSEQFLEETDELTSWLFQDQPDMLFVLPISVKDEIIGALLFSMVSVEEADQTMLTALGTVYALHVGMTYTLIQITEERQEMERQLVLQDKMASLGNLVAGVAHEVNNPIGAVNSAANVSMRCIDKISQVLSNSQTIEDIKENPTFQKAFKLLLENNQVVVDAARRITKIVQSLKNFARLDEAEFQTADIHAGIDSTLTLLHHELKNRVEIVKDYGAIPQINCYPNLLNQVFMNLFINAAHAIEGSGKIKIKTSTDGTHVYVNITDTGKGIPPEHLGSIFDPGFTTKGVGVGTGLGLSICYNIIQDHKGNIGVQSTIGQGTEFIFAHAGVNT